VFGKYFQATRQALAEQDAPLDNDGRNVPGFVGRDGARHQLARRPLRSLAIEVCPTEIVGIDEILRRLVTHGSGHDEPSFTRTDPKNRPFLLDTKSWQATKGPFVSLVWMPAQHEGQRTLHYGGAAAQPTNARASRDEDHRSPPVPRSLVQLTYSERRQGDPYATSATAATLLAARVRAGTTTCVARLRATAACKAFQLSFPRQNSPSPHQAWFAPWVDTHLHNLP
jgi:hypothetical protein